jgi:hypothetical protein
VKVHGFGSEILLDRILNEFGVGFGGLWCFSGALVFCWGLLGQVRSFVGFGGVVGAG